MEDNKRTNRSSDAHAKKSSAHIPADERAAVKNASGDRRNGSAVHKKNSAKRKKKKKTAIVVISVLLAIFAAILVLIAVLFSMVRDLYGNAFDHDGPEIVTRDEEYTADIWQMPGIVTDEAGKPVTGNEGEDPEEPIVTGTVDGDVMHGSEVLPSDGSEISKKYPIYKKDQIDKNVMNIVIVGRDVGSTYGRADSSMLISYNKKTNSVKIVSLLRDVYVPIEDHNWNKLGHSLSYGGMGLYINTVNYVYDLDIQRYAMIDFDGVVDVINEIGGVKVSITKREAEYYNACYGWGIKAGTVRLNGDQVLKHCRNRAIGNDYERTRRQRDVIVAVYEKVLDMGMSKGLDVIEMALGYIKTNIPFETCISIATDIFTSGGLDDLQTEQMPFAGTFESTWAVPPGYKNGMSVLKLKSFEESRKQLRDYLY